jgi:hypothetical protein
MEVEPNDPQEVFQWQPNQEVFQWHVQPECDMMAEQTPFIEQEMTCIDDEDASGDELPTFSFVVDECDSPIWAYISEQYYSDQIEFPMPRECKRLSENEYRLTWYKDENRSKKMTLDIREEARGPLFDVSVETEIFYEKHFTTLTPLLFYLIYRLRLIQ